MSLLPPQDAVLERPFTADFLIRSSHDQKSVFVLTDLGPGQWETETVPDRTH